MLRLGENALGGYKTDLDDLLDNKSLIRVIPGDFRDMRRFVLKNIGHDKKGNLIGHGDNGSWKCTKEDKTNPFNWACHGDGIVPAISQRLTRLPGFSPGG